MQTVPIDPVAQRLDLVIDRLETLIGLYERQIPKVEETWIDSREFCRMTGIPNKAALHYAMSKGVISGDALRNIGTAKRPRYRFHRRKAVDQFLNRAV